MKIDLMASANSIDEKKLIGATAVVIDVLRATSVMVTAFANGLDKLITVASPEEAFSLRQQNPGYLLGGEKDAVYVPGFDLDNSPFNYSRHVVEGRTLVMSTSNGTRAIKGALGAGDLIIASFLNAEAVVNYILEKDKVVLVCSGSNNAFTLEDALCAGYIAYLVQCRCNELKMSDFVVSMLQLYKAFEHDIQASAGQGNHYKLLVQKGFAKDLDYCFTPNQFNLVPRLKNGAFVLA